MNRNANHVDGDDDDDDDDHDDGGGGFDGGALVEIHSRGGRPR